MRVGCGSDSVAVSRARALSESLLRVRRCVRGCVWRPSVDPAQPPRPRPPPREPAAAHAHAPGARDALKKRASSAHALGRILTLTLGTPRLACAAIERARSLARHHERVRRRRQHHHASAGRCKMRKAARDASHARNAHPTDQCASVNTVYGTCAQSAAADRASRYSWRKMRSSISAPRPVKF